MPMIELCRTIRFCLNDVSASACASLKTARDNTFNAWPAMRGLGRYYELEVACKGEADPATGYFMNIVHIDAAVREHALPLLERILHEADSAADLPMGQLMRSLLDVLQPALDGTIDRLRLTLSPRYAITLRSQQMNTVQISQHYEFSAAHRLHVDSLSDEKNRAVFGKCNNPAGHGHNYCVEVTVAVPINDLGHLIPVEQLDAIVNQHAIEKLDHKHLNRDVPQFAKLNPSVEHIVQVVWDMLADRIAEIQGRLETVRVWETGKTVCTYHGPNEE